MTEKERRSFTIDSENDELCQDHDNASALVNELLEQYRKGSDKETVGIDLQIRQKKKEITSKQEDVDRLKDDLEELEQLRAGIKQQEDAEFEDAYHVLEDVDWEPTNPGVENWADDLGLTPQQLIHKLEERRGNE